MTHRARLIYERRCDSDLLYQVLTTASRTELDPHVQGVIRIASNRQLSQATRAQLQAALDDDDSVRKHALVLFALHAEPSVREYLGKRSTTAALAQFTQRVLPALVNRVTTGVDTLEEFVTSGRDEYITM